MTVVWRWRNLPKNRGEMSKDLKTSHKVASSCHNNVPMFAGMKIPFQFNVIFKNFSLAIQILIRVRHF